MTWVFVVSLCVVIPNCGFRKTIAAIAIAPTMIAVRTAVSTVFIIYLISPRVVFFLRYHSALP